MDWLFGKKKVEEKPKEGADSITIKFDATKLPELKSLSDADAKRLGFPEKPKMKTKEDL
jgi:hypothetical protein